MPKSFREILHEIHFIAVDFTHIGELSVFCRLAVEACGTRLGFGAAELFLCDSGERVARGTWRAAEDGELEDISAVVHPLHPISRGRDGSATCGEYFKLETGWSEAEYSWKATINLCDGKNPLGWLSVSSPAGASPFEAELGEILCIYGAIITTTTIRLRLATRIDEVVETKCSDLKEGEAHFKSLFAKAEDELERRDRLFGILAHDLRGPIGNMNTIIGMAMDSELDTETFKQFLPELRKASEAAYGLLDNILNWIRSQIDQVKILRDRFPVQRAISSVLAWENQSARIKEISLVMDCHPEISILSDERIIETILRNLVTNAIKYSFPGGKVRIFAVGSAEGGTISISVADEGLGMDSEVAARVFSRETRSSTPGTAKERGSGLGLMFCQDLAHSINGMLTFTTKPGEGSVFTLSVPDILDGELEQAI